MKTVGNAAGDHHFCLSFLKQGQKGFYQKVVGQKICLENSVVPCGADSSRNGIDTCIQHENIDGQPLQFVGCFFYLFHIA